MNIERLGKELFAWSDSVLRKTTDKTDGNPLHGIQLMHFMQTVAAPKDEENFWLSFKDVLAYTLFTLIDNEPISSKKQKATNINPTVLIPILREAGQMRPEFLEIIPLLQQGNTFPSPEAFYAALN